MEVKALNQPESWWGWHGWSQPEPLSITQIISAGTLSPRVAALLWLVMERGRSMILAADPPGAGKTTLLTALLAFARPEASLYFTRGWGETFSLPMLDAEAPTYLMVNEISDHLPVYSWGPYVQRQFELMRDGYSLLSTMHADTVDGVIEQLVEENDVPEANIGYLAFVVPMFVGVHEGRRLRRVSEVSVLEPLAASYDRHTVVHWDSATDSFDVLSTPAQVIVTARRLGMDEGDLPGELSRRERFLQDLIDGNVRDLDHVQRRVFEFAGYQVVE